MRQFADHETFRANTKMPEGMVYGPNHSRVPVAAIREMAQVELQKIINTGRANAGQVVARILDEVPEDRIVHAGSIRPLVELDGTVKLRTNDVDLGMHRHAVTQMLGRLGIPTAYADQLGVANEETKRGLVDNAWKRELLGEVLSRHLAHAGDRYLVRSVNGQVRAILSDKYRRLDARPLLDAFIGTCEEVGAIPFEGVATDLRMSVRAIIPQVFEPTPGECMVVGLSQTNSDFGAGAYTIKAFMLRLVCANGLISEGSLKEMHLGGRLPENLELSQATMDKDAATMVSATKDVVRGILAPGPIENRLDAIRKASEREVDIDTAMASVAKGLTKGEQQAVKEAFNGSDVVMLPAGNNGWRFSNALSWVANNVENPERKLELQKLAGDVIAA